MRRVSFSSPAIVFALTASVSAQDQPNPYKFPAATGDRIPILEGYWATSQDACQKLSPSDTKRPHVGLKGFAIANGDAFPTYTFQYFGPRLGGAEAREAIAAIVEKRRPDFSKFQ